MKNKTPLKVRGTKGNFVPFYKILDPNIYTGILVLDALDHKQYNKRFGYKG